MNVQPTSETQKGQRDLAQVGIPLGENPLAESRQQVIVATNQEASFKDFLDFLSHDYDVVLTDTRRSVLDEPQRSRTAAIILSEYPSDLDARDFLRRLKQPGHCHPIVIAMGRQWSPWLTFVERQTSIDGVIYYESPVEHQIRTFGLLASRGVDYCIDELGDRAQAIWRLAKDLVGHIEAHMKTGQPVPRMAVRVLAQSAVEGPDEILLMDFLSKLRSHHHETLVHSLDVALTALLLGRHVGIRMKGDQYLLFEAGLLHDIGKTKVPQSILSKPGKLLPHELAAMRQHPEAGERMLLESGDYDKQVIFAAGQHHEKNDGTGYPRGLFGPQLSEIGRFMAVCDVFCALTERRSYRSKSSAIQACALLRPLVDNHLDGVLVERLVEMVYGYMAARQFSRDDWAVTT